VAIARSDELTGVQGALKEASDALVDTLAGRFGQFVQKVIRGIVAFRDSLASLLGIVLTVATAFVDFLGFLGPGFGQFLGILASALVFMKAFSFASGVLSSVLSALGAGSALKAAGGLATLGTAVTATSTAAGAATVSVGAMTATVTAAGAAAPAAAAAMVGFGGAMGVARAAAGLLIGTLKTLLPLIAAFMAFDFLQAVGRQEEALRGQVGDLAEGRNLADLRALRDSLQKQFNELDAQARDLNPLNMFQSGAASFVRGSVEQSLNEVNRLIDILEARGPNATVIAEDLSEAFNPTNMFDFGEAVDETTTSLEEQWAQILASVDAQSRLNDETERAVQTEELFKSLADERVAALETLNQRLGEGLITQQQYAQGTEQIARASELSSQLVATYGERLGQIPLLESAAAQGAETLAGALFDLIIQSGNNIGTIEQLITRLLQLAQTQEAVARAIFNNPIHIRGILTMATQKIDSTTAANNPELLKAQQFAQATLGSQLNQVESSFTNLLNQLSNIFNQGSSTVFGTGPGGSSLPSGGGGSTASRQVSVVDIGDLDASQVAQIIAIATKLRDAIPGEKAASADELVTLIKDAGFLQNVKGIDERLLRIAIEELVEIEKDRLEQERQKAQTENILKNLVTRVGPLGALITQPTFSGVGGSLVGNNGLNFDPTQGNFVINVPIALNGLEPAKLQQLIYQTVAKAIQDAIRLGS
jgi:hypothetical protein